MIRIVLSKIVLREIPFCWSYWIIFYWSCILDLSRLMCLFLFYPIPDYSFSYEHFNTPSSIGQPRKPISNGLHQEYSSSFWLWLYKGKNRNHWIYSALRGNMLLHFDLLKWCLFFLEDGHKKKLMPVLSPGSLSYKTVVVVPVLMSCCYWFICCCL